MNLASAIKTEGRTLPVFLLVDVSGSMSGEKIGTVNTAIKEMSKRLPASDDGLD